jgi:hypothetical protein
MDEIRHPLVKTTIEAIAGEEHRRRAAWERIRRFVEQPSVVLEEPRPTRDELCSR